MAPNSINAKVGLFTILQARPKVSGERGGQGLEISTLDLNQVGSQAPYQYFGSAATDNFTRGQKRHLLTILRLFEIMRGEKHG
jgi:hypothetical protein